MDKYGPMFLTTERSKLALNAASMPCWLEPGYQLIS